MKVSGFMIDMDGTVYKGGNPIPGASDFISSLKRRGIPFVFLTNNSSAPRQAYYERVRDMGFDVSEDNVLTSNIATIRYVLDRYPGKTVFPIASDDVIGELKAAGIRITDKDPDIVYLTFDRTIDYWKINEGYHHILGGSRLVATHPDDVCPTEDSYDVDIGPFIRLFESLTGCRAEIIGKPNKLMLDMAASEMGVDPEETVMIGDRLYTDIKMAADAGISSILVLSGETRMADLKGSSVKPTYVVDSVVDIISMLDG